MPLWTSFFFFFLKKIYFYFLVFLFSAASGLSYGMQDLPWGMWDISLWHAGSLLRCTGFSLVVACGFSLSSCGVQAPGHVGSVVCGTQALLLRCASLVVVAHRLSCPVACWILVPWPGIEASSPALEGGFFTTGPPGPRYERFMHRFLSGYIFSCVRYM